MRDRIENEVFFATPQASRAQPVVAEDIYYRGRPRPPPDVVVAVRAASTPMRFAMILFLTGWAGIIFQNSLLQQVVFGAPVFEEFAKFGPPLALVILMRVRTLWIRMPLAWASGAAFGVFEHYSTYVEEPAYMFGERVAFHALSPGLSMLTWGALEGMTDVRARWAATVPATLFHWANNFLAIVLGIATYLVGLSLEAMPIAMVFTTVITGSMALVMLGGMLARERYEATVRRILVSAMPRLGFGEVR